MDIHNKKGETALVKAQDPHTEWNDEQTLRNVDEDKIRQKIVTLLKSAGAKE